MRYIHDHGISEQTLAKVGAKNLANGAHTPHAWRRKPMSVDAILGSPVMNARLRQHLHCNPNEGAATVLVCRADKGKQYKDTPICLRSVALRSRRAGVFELLPRVDRAAAGVRHHRKTAYAAGIGPDDVDVVQVQDPEADSELIHVAETRPCKDAEQEAMIYDGATEIGRRIPVNTDGGLIANGEPVSGRASGLRQVFELVQQLRDAAGDRQVHGDPRVALTHRAPLPSPY
jgi:acetyl-CoA C-acetyltransferase